MGTLIVGIVVFGMIGAAARSVFLSKKKGNACGCGCEGCSKSDSCH